MNNDTPLFLERDLSWLAFNARILTEAENDIVPLLEQLNFLSIFSSNLDEFYKVRIPKLLTKLDKELLIDVTKEIVKQQELFGEIVLNKILPKIQNYNTELIYNKPIPKLMEGRLKQYFIQNLQQTLEPHAISVHDNIFVVKSNSLYQAVFMTSATGEEHIYIHKIPTNKFNRFYEMDYRNHRYIIFLDDILKKFTHEIYHSHTVKSIWNFKVTRDANINLENEDDIVETLETHLEEREKGKATRFLYEKDMPIEKLKKLLALLNISIEDAVAGGTYHHLRDLNMLSIDNEKASYPPMLPIERYTNELSIFGLIDKQDFILHTPYESYDRVVKFFMEAATDEDVYEIYTTIYRTAKNSTIIEALMIAAKMGKRVTVFVELKARFDEENNLKWLKRMKSVGVYIITSIPKLKVHSKIALVRRKKDGKETKYSLISTGNFNESTARYYTDHILFTCDPKITTEIEKLFHFLLKQRKPISTDELSFEHLSVGQFNLRHSLLEMIDREITNHKEGKLSGIIIKINNLEEKTIINKLYEASQAGVKIELIVRSICCLAPGVHEQSENIKITRIVDRYLEHGRVFIFNNDGKNHILIGSSDIMNRSIYKRIEVLCPIYSTQVKDEILKIISLQLQDNVKASEVNIKLDNKPVLNNNPCIHSQNEIYNLIARSFTSNI